MNRKPAAGVALWFTPGRFALLLGLLLAGTFLQVIAGRMSFFYRDYSSFTYPVAWYQRECFWRGELPLWNPFNNAGIPFLAQWNTAGLYPPSLFYLLFPLPWSLGVFQIAHLFLAGMGMFLLARRWTGNLLAAALAGLAFAFSGLSWHLVMWVSNLAALAWMPWVVLAAESVRAETGAAPSGNAVTQANLGPKLNPDLLQPPRGPGRSIALAALAGAAQMLTGAPEIILQTWCFIGLLILVRVLRDKAPKMFAAKRFLLLVALVAGLSAVQLVPFLDLLAHSHRGSAFTETDVEWAMPGYGLANFLVPLFHCCASAHGVLVQVKQGWATSYYAGVGMVALAVLAVWRVRSWRVVLLAAAAALSLWLARGADGQLLPAIKTLLPQLGYMRYPIKFVAFAAFALPLLAAHGVGWLLAAGPSVRPRRSLVLTCLAVLGLIGIVAWQGWQEPFAEGAIRENVALTLRNGVERGAFLALMAGALMLLLRSQREGVQLAAALTLLLGQWLDVYTHAPAIQPLVEPSVYQPGLIRQEMKLPPLGGVGEGRAALTEIVLQKVNYIGRPRAREDCLFARSALIDDWNLLDRVAKTDGFFSSYLSEAKRVGDLVAAGEGRGLDLKGLKDFLGVRYLGVDVNAANDGLIWVERNSGAPLVTAGQRPEFFGDEDVLENLAARPMIDLRRTVFLPLEARPLISATNQVDAGVRPVHCAAQRIEFEVEAAAPALVTVAQAFYHPWHAYVDGRRTPLWKANGAFQALEVPAGKHRVRLIYQDWGFYCGLVVSAITFVAVVGLLFWPARNRQGTAAR